MENVYLFFRSLISLMTQIFQVQKFEKAVEFVKNLSCIDRSPYIF